MEDFKMFSVRIPKELWSFLMKNAIDRETSANQIILELLNKYRKNCEKNLTNHD